MSSIREMGGEFALIDEIARLPSALAAGTDAGEVLVGIGDDCAVLRYHNDELLLVTTDMLVEGDHFRLDWASPFQVGLKAAESNLSDVVAMVGRPHWGFVSLAISRHTDYETVMELYRGLDASFQRAGVRMLGGDTTHGNQLVLSLTIMGLVKGARLRLRSHAVVGDVIGVTGDLGGSRAGLELLLAGMPERGDLSRHLEPRCRLDLLEVVPPHVHALIDVSDGLASEVRHICRRSGVGAEVYSARIPLSESTRATAQVLGSDPYRWALSGGEDFELVFTCAPEQFRIMTELGADVTEVGRILSREKGIWLVTPDGERTPLEGGYDHFTDA